MQSLTGASKAVIRPSVAATCTLICLVIVTLFCFHPMLQAKEQRLKYEMDTYFYEIVFDDDRISLNEMKQVALLSPYVQLDAGTPFIMTLSTYKRGTDIMFDKKFIVPWLELWNPGYTDDMNSPEPDAAFLKNAALNLRKGEEQTEILRQERVPAILEPVKDYLLRNMEFYSELEKTRYGYLKTGDTTKLRQILCEQCSCGEAQEDLLHRASTNLTGKERLRLTLEWYKQAHRCHDQRTGTYPVAVWKNFLKEFGVTEHMHYKHID